MTDKRVVFSWRHAGAIVLDAENKLRFPEVPPSPGLYRMTLTGGANQTKPRIYTGEGKSLKTRMGGYMNPGGRDSERGQQTNIKIHDELVADALQTTPEALLPASRRKRRRGR